MDGTLENISNTSALTPDGMCELQSLSERFLTNAKQISPDIRNNPPTDNKCVEPRGSCEPRIQSETQAWSLRVWRGALMCAEKPPLLRSGKKKKRNDGEGQLGHWFQLRPRVHYIHKQLAFPSLLLGRENILWNAKQRSGHLASTANYCKALVLMNVLPQQFWFNCTVKTARSKHLAN